MQTRCPSCDAPLDDDATVLSREKNIVVSRCGSCGVLLSNVSTDLEVKETLDSRSVFADTSQPAIEATVPGTAVPEYGQRVAHFELDRVLGQGAFGAVWLARDTHLGRPVALKLPKDPDAQLLHEAQTAARLKHPNIVAVFEVGVEDNRAYIASEFIDGETLKDELLRGRPKVQRSVDVMTTIALAADHAHSQKVVHRDMKPANVMINREGDPFITDFGIAKSIAADETISLDGEIVGTIAYMAPEQARGKNQQTDSRADIYAMGVMLFELLTEYRPFRGNAQGILYQKEHEDAPSPRTLVPALPRDLETICLKCLERDPDKRYQTARQLAEELQRFRQNIPILARPVSRMEKAWRWCCRNPGVAWLSILLFSSLVCGLIGVSYFWRNATLSTERTRKTLYRAHMNLASTAWASANVDAVHTYLKTYESADDSPLRDFAWHYHKQVISPIRNSVNHGTAITAIAISRDGKLLATIGSRDRTLRVWEGVSGKLILDLTDLPFQSQAVDFSPTDDRLLTGDDDGNVRVWNPTQHAHVAFELEHGNSVTSACFSPDRRFIASGDLSGRVRIWQVASKEMLAEFVRPNQSVIDLAFSPDSSKLGVLLTTGSTPAARLRSLVDIRDVASLQQIVETDPQRQLSSLQFDGLGENVVVTSGAGAIYMYSAEAGEELLRYISKAGTAIGDVTRLSGSGDFVAVDGLWQTLLLDDSLRETHKLFTHRNTFGVIDSSDNGEVIAVGSGDGRATLILTSLLSVPQIGWQSGIIRDVAFCSDERRVAVACHDGAARIWDPDTGDFETIIPADESGRAMLSVSVHGDRIAGCGMMRELQIASVASMSSDDVRRLAPGGHEAVAWSVDGKFLAVGSRSGNLGIYTFDNLKDPVMTVTGNKQVNALAFGKASNRIAAVSQDITIRIADPADQSVREIDFGIYDEPLSVVFCDDDTRLIVGTQQGDLHFIDLTGKTQTEILKAHAGRINDLAVFPDGTQLVSAGQDRVLRIWDIRSTELITQLDGHDRGIVAVDVSADGRTLATSSVDGDVRVWRSKPVDKSRSSAKSEPGGTVAIPIERSTAIPSGNSGTTATEEARHHNE